MKEIIGLCIGACSGAILRYQLGLWLNPKWAYLPLGTLLVNAIGGLLIGILMACILQFSNLSGLFKITLITGFLGSLTTFSSFSYEVFDAAQKGAWGSALTEVVLHMSSSILLCALGFYVTRMILQME